MKKQTTLLNADKYFSKMPINHWREFFNYFLLHFLFCIENKLRTIRQIETLRDDIKSDRKNYILIYFYFHNYIEEKKEKKKNRNTVKIFKAAKCLYIPFFFKTYYENLLIPNFTFHVVEESPREFRVRECACQLWMRGDSSPRRSKGEGSKYETKQRKKKRKRKNKREVEKLLTCKIVKWEGRLTPQTPSSP